MYHPLASSTMAAQAALQPRPWQQNQRLLLKFAIFHTVEEKGGQSFESFYLKQSFLFKAKSSLCLYPFSLLFGSWAQFLAREPQVLWQIWVSAGYSCFLLTTDRVPQVGNFWCSLQLPCISLSLDIFRFSFSFHIFLSSFALFLVFLFPIAFSFFCFLPLRISTLNHLEVEHNSL